MSVYDKQHPFPRRKNRDSFYMNYVILKIIESQKDNNIGVTKTNLIYRSYTSSGEMSAYLQRLLGIGVISVQNISNKQLYSLTEKGTKYLNLMNNFIELIPHQFHKDFENPS